MNIERLEAEIDGWMNRKVVVRVDFNKFRLAVQGILKKCSTDDSEDPWFIVRAADSGLWISFFAKDVTSIHSDTTPMIFIDSATVSV